MVVGSDKEADRGGAVRLDEGLLEVASHVFEVTTLSATCLEVGLEPGPLSAVLSEAEVHWRAFLEDLRSRGLCGMRMISSDDHRGLRAAIKAVFTGVAWQRCQFHVQQNAQAYVPAT